MTPVEQNVTHRFFTLYGTPSTPNAEAFVDEYEKAFAGTDPDLLEAASNLLVKQHKYRNWPTVGEVATAIETVAVRRNRERDLKAALSAPPADGPKDVPPDARTRVDALMRECVANLKKMGPPAPKADPVDWQASSRPAWEARFGKGPRGAING